MTEDLILDRGDRSEGHWGNAARQSAAKAGDRLAASVARVLGVAPEEAAGVLTQGGLPLLRTEIASRCDALVARLLAERGVRQPAPVTPALAIPLLRAAYDESRAELQDLWARLLAAAMDPARAGAVRQSFIAAVQQLDPLDARILLWIFGYRGPDIVNVADRAGKELNASADAMQISFENLARIGCICHDTQRRQRAVLTPFGRQLLSICYD